MIIFISVAKTNFKRGLNSLLFLPPFWFWIKDKVFRFVSIKTGGGNSEFFCNRVGCKTGGAGAKMGSGRVLPFFAGP
jgi:hypothetical protein